MNAPSSDTSMAITPATTDGSAIPAPLDSTVVGRIGISLENSDQSASFGMYPPVASVIPDLMLPGRHAHSAQAVAARIPAPANA